jgi:hypothetical protein
MGQNGPAPKLRPGFVPMVSPPPPPRGSNGMGYTPPPLRPATVVQCAYCGTDQLVDNDRGPWICCSCGASGRATTPEEMFERPKIVQRPTETQFDSDDLPSLFGVAVALLILTLTTFVFVGLAMAIGNWLFPIPPIPPMPRF